jgi:hypothetical protein
MTYGSGSHGSDSQHDLLAACRGHVSEVELQLQRARDVRGMRTRPVAWCENSCKRRYVALGSGRNSGCLAERPASGYLRLRPASCGNFRAECAPDETETSGQQRLNGRHKVLICRTFTGATGLEPATLRRDRPVMALPARAGIGGDYPREQGLPTLPLRGLPGTSGSFRRPAAGCARNRLVARSANCGCQRDEVRVLSLNALDGRLNRGCSADRYQSPSLTYGWLQSVTWRASDFVHASLSRSAVAASMPASMMNGRSVLVSGYSVIGR